MRHTMKLKADPLTERYMAMLERVRAKAHPDCSRFWLEHGRYNLWADAIEALDQAIETGNRRVIDAAFVKTEHELELLVRHHWRWVRWLEAPPSIPDYREKIPLWMIPPEMRATFPEHMIDNEGAS